MDRGLIATLGTLSLFAFVFGLWMVNQYLHTPYTTTPLPPSIPLSPTQVAHLNNVAIPIAAVATNTHPNDTSTTPTSLSTTSKNTYLIITTGCLFSITSDCKHAFSRPSATSTIRTALRIGAVLLVKNSTTTASGTVWYQIDFDEGLRYSERLTLPWYVRSDAGELVTLDGPQDLGTSTPSTTKSLIVDRSDQKLYAFDGDTLVYTYRISTGLDLSPTPRGIFTVYRKTPTRYMQGPIPGINTHYYDLPGVPWNLYFTEQGAVVHGAYWHNDFGKQHSNGCVNVRPEEARVLYDWADLGMKVTVRD
jgi:L,D-transpeptidase catalytic domain